MTVTAAIRIPHIVQGTVRFGDAVEHSSRIGERVLTPRLDLDELVVPRSTPGPAFDVPINEVLQFLGETGRQLDYDTNPYLAEAAEMMSGVSPHSRRIIEHSYRELAEMFEPEALGYQIERELGSAVLDGWVPVHRPGLPPARIRAFPPRLLHVMPGNGPGGAAMSIIRGALTKGINLLKLPSNDLCTATAILRTMIAIDPDHPVVRSFSAVYWRGGDASVDSLLLRPQYFDKVVAWGGENTIRHIVGYLGPGLELVAFDPKASISMIGREAFTDEQTLARVVELAATDVTVMNQEACVASRYQFIEGSLAEIDTYCEMLAAALAADRAWSDAQIWKPDRQIRDSVEVFEMLESHRVWGKCDGRGLVLRSDEPVDFHPSAKTVNVVPVGRLEDATHRATVATQTVGVYPTTRKAQLRNALACAGVQRVVDLGNAMGLVANHGLPHDGFFPLQRMVRWVSDEDL